MAARPANKPDKTTYRGRVGAAIKSRREKLGLTPDDLAALLRSEGADVSREAVYKYERGERPISTDDLPALAKALRTTIAKLLPPS